MKIKIFKIVVPKRQKQIHQTSCYKLENSISLWWQIPLNLLTGSRDFPQSFKHVDDGGRARDLDDPHNLGKEERSLGLPCFKANCDTIIKISGRITDKWVAKTTCRSEGWNDGEKLSGGLQAEDMGKSWWRGWSLRPLTGSRLLEGSWSFPPRPSIDWMRPVYV